MSSSIHCSVSSNNRRSNNSRNHRRHNRQLVFVLTLALYPLVVWTWTTSPIGTSLSSRFTQNHPQQQQRISIWQDLTSLNHNSRNDKLTLLQLQGGISNERDEQSSSSSSSSSRLSQQSQRNLLSRLFQRRRSVRRATDDLTILYASNNDDDNSGDVVNDDNSSEDNSNNEDDEDVIMEIADALTSSTTESSSSFTLQNDNDKSEQQQQQQLQQPQNNFSPFTPQPPSPPPSSSVKKSFSKFSKSSFTKKIGAINNNNNNNSGINTFNSGGAINNNSLGNIDKSKLDNVGARESMLNSANTSKVIGGGESSGNESVVEVPKPPPPRPPPLKGTLKRQEEERPNVKSPALFLKGIIPTNNLDTNDSSTNATAAAANNNGNSSGNKEQQKYLNLAQEAYTKFFKDQMSQEEYVDMALDVWNDASSPSDDSGGSGGGVVVVDSDAASSDGGGNNISDGAKQQEEEEGGKGFLSGLKSSLFSGVKKSSSKSNAQGMETKEEEEEEDDSVPYGLRKSSVVPSSPPKQLSLSKGAAVVKTPAVMKKAGGSSGDALKNYISSVKAKSMGEKQQKLTTTTSSPPPSSINKGSISPPPISKGVSSPILNKGVLKGKEGGSSLGGINASSKSSSPSGDIKLGMKGKFAPKKIDTSAKKNWQGNRGGLSFLKSDKLSKEYTAEKNYNPMNKGVTVNTLKGIKLGSKMVNGEEKPDDGSDEETDLSGDNDQGGESVFESIPISSSTSPPPAEKQPQAQRVERWSKESFQSILKGSESSPGTNGDNLDTDLPEGKTTTISITDEGGTDVVNPGRAFIPLPRESIDTKGGISSGVKFASTKLGLKGGMVKGGGINKFGKSSGALKGSAKILASKSGFLSGGSKKFGTPSSFGIVNKLGTKKLDFSLMKKEKGSQPLVQKFGGMAGIKRPVESTKKATPSKSLQKKTADTTKSDANTTNEPFPTIREGITAEEASATRKERVNEPKIKPTPSQIVMPVMMEGMTAEEAQAVRERRLGVGSDFDTEGSKSMAEAKDSLDVKSNVDELSPPTVLIAEGVTAEEAEQIRRSRPGTGEQTTSEIMNENISSTDTPMAITEGMTAEEAEKARMARQNTSATKGKEQDEKIPTLNQLKKVISTGLKQPELKSKGMPFMKKAPSFSMEKKSLPPLPLKGPGDGAAGLKKGLGMAPMAKQSLGDGVAKKGFPSPPLPMKKAEPLVMKGQSPEASDDGSVPTTTTPGLPLKGGISTGLKQPELKSKGGMPFMKKAPSFSMEKKSLPPLPLKGPGDGAAGLKKGLGMAPMAKQSLGDGVAKKGFPSPPLPMKKAEPLVMKGQSPEASDDGSVPTTTTPGLPLKGGISTGLKQPELKSKGGMPFMKKAPSFSMEKKSLPPLPLKGPGDGAAGLKKGLGMAPMAKQSLGDGVAKKGFPSPPLPMKKAEPLVMKGQSPEASDDGSVPTTTTPGLPLKGGISTGLKQPELKSKGGMPFMKKAPSFSMEKKSLPPLPLKGPGDGAAGLKKGLGMAPMAKQSLGDGVAKKGFPSPPLPMKKAEPLVMKGQSPEASDDGSVPTTTTPGLPLKGGISTGLKQPELKSKGGMPFMKKAPSFSMEKKSLPPLPLKGPGDGAAGLKKGLGMAPMAKQSLGDGVAKKGFPSPPLPMKKAEPLVMKGQSPEASDDGSVPTTTTPGLPLKGGISTGLKQPELKSKGGMPFMKKAPSFSMEKKSLPPLPLKGPGDGAAGLKKGLGMAPMAKQSLGDGVAKKGFPSPPLPMKKAEPLVMKGQSPEASDDGSVPTTTTPGLPLKGGISTGLKQPELKSKGGMPFMKKAPSFSMEKKSLPPLPLKGPGDGAAGLKKGLGMAPMAKQSLGDGVAKKGFPSPPLPMKKAEPLVMKGQSPEASDDGSVPTTTTPGLPLKGGISTGLKQPELKSKGGMPFMKKAPSFSMEKKSLPPLPLKGPGDGAAGLKKGLGMAPMAKQSLGDGVAKKGFPSPPLPMKKAEPLVMKGQSPEASDDGSVPTTTTPGLPLKGGISTGLKQPELKSKGGMPFMKKAPSFSMEKKSLPPLPLKGPGDGAAGLKKGLGMAPMAKQSLGDGVAKKGFPSPPLPMKKAEPLVMKGQSPEASDDGSVPTTTTPGLPLKGGISTGLKQPELKSKGGMPFMKKAPSFSMEKKSLPPLPLKGPGDGAAGLKKGLGMAPMAKQSLGDGVAKKGFPSPPLPMKKAAPLVMKGQSPESSDKANGDSFIGQSFEVSSSSISVSDDDVTLDFAESDSSVSSWSSTPDKELGKGAAFLPQFAPPPIRGEPADPNDFSWLEAAEAKDVDASAGADDARSSNDDGPMKEARKQSQSKEPTKLWSGESFLGTSSSRVYGLGSVRSSGSSGKKGKKVLRGKSNDVTLGNEATDSWASEDLADAARLIDEMNDAVEVEESLIAQKDCITDEKMNTDALLSDTEEKLSTQLDKFEEERQILRDDKARAEAERSEADQMIQEIELARMKAEKEAEELQQRFAEEKAALSAKLTEAVRTRTDDEKRLIDEKAKVAALITEAERKLAIQLDKFEEERLKMNEEKETASAKIEEANSARMKAEQDAKTLETVLSEQKLKQEKWMEEQTLLIERMLEKRIAAEKSKIEAALTEAKAKEEARLAEEQNRLVEEQLEQRLAEEKSKLSAEITAAEEKIRRELDNLESERGAQEEKATTEEKPQEEVLDIPRPEAEESIPDDEMRLPTLTTTPSDALAADVEALELISMCEAEYDLDSPTKPSPPSADSCLLPSDYPFVSLLRDSSPYIVNHRHSTIVYHIPGDLISDVEKFNSVMDDIALTWLFGMKIVLCVGCRTQVSQRLDTLQGVRSKYTSGMRITSTEALRVLEEEAGFCRFEVERQLNRCLRNKGADCNVVSGCFITAKKFGVVDGVDYQQTGYPTTLQTDRIHRFLLRSDVVLLTPLGFTGEGHAVNIKSEQLAGFTAGALKASKVVYFSTKPLVMRGSSDNDRDDNGNQRIQMIQRSSVLQILSHHGLKIHSKTGFPHWRNESRVAATNRDVQDMLLKMGWATDAIDKGVERAHIIACEDGALLEELFTARRGYGTCISQDDYEAPHPEDQNDDLIADEVGAGMIEW